MVAVVDNEEEEEEEAEHHIGEPEQAVLIASALPTAPSLACTLAIVTVFGVLLHRACSSWLPHRQYLPCPAPPHRHRCLCCPRLGLSIVLGTRGPLVYCPLVYHGPERVQDSSFALPV